MKAVFLERTGGPDVLLYGDFPNPTESAGRTVVRVRACALNHLDLWVRSGIPAYKIELPHILGNDIAGELVSENRIGSKIFPKDSRVVIFPGVSCDRCEFCLQGRDNICETYGILGANGGQGGYAEYVSVPSENVFPIPREISFEEAASFPLTFLTAWHMLVTHAQVGPGKTVLVLGAGSGVGIAAMQVAASAGSKVIAASSSLEKLEAAKRFGIHAAVHSPPEDLHRRILALTDGKGVDIVFEHVGPAILEKAIKSLKPGGILVTCGATSGPSFNLDLRYLFSRELRIQGSKMGTRAEFSKVVELIASGKLKPIVDRIFPLQEARQAQEFLESRRQFGKVVLKI